MSKYGVLDKQQRLDHVSRKPPLIDYTMSKYGVVDTLRGCARKPPLVD
jgi:hypothetical protein